MRKTLRKTLKKNNKAGNRFLESKVQIASMYNGAQRDVTNMVLRNFAASKIQKNGRTMVNKRNFEIGLANFHNSLIRFVIVLRRPNPNVATMTTIKDTILATIPDRTVDGFLREPNLYEQINLLRNILSNHFPPLNERENNELIELIDSIIQVMNVPLRERILMLPLLPYRQQAVIQAQGRKRKTRRAKRRN